MSRGRGIGWVSAFAVAVLGLGSVFAETLQVSNGRLEASLDAIDGSLTVNDLASGRTWHAAAEFAARPVVVTEAAVDTSSKTAYPTTIRCKVTPKDQPTISVCLTILENELELALDAPPETAYVGALAWPFPFTADAGDRFILPHGCGYSFAAETADFGTKALDRMKVYTRDMKMGCWAQYAECVGADGALEQQAGMLAILETPVDAVVSFGLRSNGRRAVGPEWTDEDGHFGYARRLRYCFFREATPAALAARYRAEMDKRGFRVTFREKARRNPRIAEGLSLLKGAPDIWYWTTRSDKADVARSLRSIGFANMLFSSVTRRDLGVWVTPEEVKAVAEIPDVLQTEYDIYTDTMEPSMLDKIDAVRPHWPLEVWDNGDYIMTAEGKPARGWRVALKTDPTKPVVGCLRLCEKQAPRYLRERVSKRLAEAPYKARFFDVTGTSVGSCQNPKHPLTRRQSMKARKDLLAIAGREYGLVTGTEDGLECYVPECDYFEGNFSAAHWRVDGGRYMWKIYDETPPIMERAIDPAIRFPFWEMVFHDCIVSYWYWTDYNNKFPQDWWKRDLLNVVAGTPPMYFFTPEVYADQKERLGASVRVATSTARDTADAVFTGFRWLTADRLVQQSEFSNGVTVVANFSEQPYRLPDGRTVPPHGHLRK